MENVVFMSNRRVMFSFFILFPILIFAGTGSRIVFSADTVVSNDILVPEGYTCIIKPGVTLRFDGYYRIAVEGILIAEGTSQSPIRISSINRPKGSAAKPSWSGIEVRGKKSYARLIYCSIEGAYKNLFWESSAVIENCEFTGNHYAVYSAKHATPHIKNNVFHRNVFGVVVDFASPLLLDNRITDNIVGVHLQFISESIIGRNVISGNKTNIRTQQAFGDNKSSTTLHDLWNIMSQLY